MNSADTGPYGLSRSRPANDNAKARRARGGLHLSLNGAEVLITHYPGGVGLGMVTGDARCGVSLSRADAEALARALLNDARTPGCDPSTTTDEVQA